MGCVQVLRLSRDPGLSFAHRSRDEVAAIADGEILEVFEVGAARLAAFAAVFALALIIVSFFTPLFSSLVQRSALGGLDQGLGFLFGVARGVLLVAIGFFVYDTVMTGQNYTVVDESRSALVFTQLSDKIEAQNPEQALGWITQQYEDLVGTCSASVPTPTPEAAPATE